MTYKESCCGPFEFEIRSMIYGDYFFGVWVHPKAKKVKVYCTKYNQYHKQIYFNI